jgi:rubredoxin
MEDKIKCPDCNGLGCWFPAFPHKEMRDQLNRMTEEEIKELFKCRVCNGSKEVSKETLNWIRDGKLLKDKRIGKEIVLSKAAKMLNVDARILSDMEIGASKPDMSIYDSL